MPFELMRHTFKSAQKLLEREILHVTQTVSDMTQTAQMACATSSNGENVDTTAIIKLIDQQLERLAHTKNKLHALNEQQESYLRISQIRLNHLLDLYSIKDFNDANYFHWTKIKLDRYLCDYLLRSGYSVSATKLANAKKINDLVDFELLNQCQIIRQSLKNGSTAKCLNWCHENRLFLKKAKSDLEYQVRLQQFVELVRENKSLDAIVYFRKHIAPHAFTQPIGDIKKVVTLLVFPSNHALVPAYKQLYSPDRWTKLIDLFTMTFYSLHHLPAVPLIQIVLSAGISSLKTPGCATTPQQVLDRQPWHFYTGTLGTSSSLLCPVCSTELCELAAPLPYAHHVKSILDPDPVVLPNGRVYGRKRLEKYSESVMMLPGRIQDPQTHEEFSASSLKVVYPS